jgi:hypothetical protein
MAGYAEQKLMIRGLGTQDSLGMVNYLVKKSMWENTFGRAK